MTAEDAGAGVQAGTLVLTVRPEGVLSPRTIRFWRHISIISLA